jgi:hypothetical protein
MIEIIWNLDEYVNLFFFFGALFSAVFRAFIGPNVKLFFGLKKHKKNFSTHEKTLIKFIDESRFDHKTKNSFSAFIYLFSFFFA